MHQQCLDAAAAELHAVGLEHEHLPPVTTINQYLWIKLKLKTNLYSTIQSQDSEALPFHYLATVYVQLRNRSVAM